MPAHFSLLNIEPTLVRSEELKIEAKWHFCCQNIDRPTVLIISSSHLSLNCESCWGTTDDFATNSLHFPVFHCPMGLGELQACPFPDVVFPPLFLSALSSSPFRCKLQDGSGQTWWTWDMTILLQFASLYHGQEVFVCPIACWILARTSSLVNSSNNYTKHAK